MSRRILFLFAIPFLAAGCCDHPPSTVPATWVRATVAPVPRPYVTRPTFATGDWVRISVVGLPNSKDANVSYARVTIKGTVRFPRLDRMAVAGLTPRECALAAADEYGRQQIGDGIKVTIDVVSFQQPGDPLPRVIRPFDLVRVDFERFSDFGIRTLIERVTAEGTIEVPLIDTVKVAGLDDESASDLLTRAISQGQILVDIPVEVTTLEQAPPDAEHLDLPDGPVYPVPELLKPVFDPSKSLTDPGPAASALMASTSTVQVDRSGQPPLARYCDYPGPIRVGDWLRVEVGGFSEPSYVRVNADGNVILFCLKQIHAAGITHRELERVIIKAYVAAEVLRNPFVRVGSLFLQQQGASLPRPIAPFDLVRIDLYGIDGRNGKFAMIQRVGADGRVKIPSVGVINITGMGDDAASIAVRNKLGPNMSAVVTTIEQAPPDPGQRVLPAGPVLPVPDPLVPLFSR